MTIFVYGTLQIDAVMQAVTGRRFEGAPATLDGYTRRRLRERTYPAVVPEADARTEGVVFRGLDDDALARLDVFEDVLYERLRLPVRTGDAQTEDAWVYVLAAEHAGWLSDEPWDLDEFVREHGDAFLAACREEAVAR
jgi:gamma-glutamylcyclotransferase (GGCT)/AIG2-like uncharacterized protein YtfP